MEGKFKCDPVGGETRSSADESCRRLVAFEATLAANSKTYVPIKKVSKDTRTRLVEYLRTQAIEGRPLPVHPSAPKKIFIQRVAELAEIKGTTLEETVHPNRKLVDACAEILGVESIYEGAGPQYERAAQLRKELDDYLARLADEGRGVPVKDDGTVNLSEVCRQTKMNLGTVTENKNLRKTLDDARGRLGVQRARQARTGPVTLEDLGVVIDAPAIDARQAESAERDDDKTYQLRFALKLAAGASIEGIKAQARPALEAAIEKETGRNRSRVRSALNVLDELERLGNIPEGFRHALEYLIDRSGKSVKQTARDAVMKPATLDRWLHGTAPDRLQGYAAVKRLEALFGLPPKKSLWGRILWVGSNCGTVRKHQWPKEVPENDKLRNRIIARLPDDTFARSPAAARAEILKQFEVVKAILTKCVDQNHVKRSASHYRLGLEHWTTSLLEDRKSLLAHINNVVPHFGEKKLVGPWKPPTENVSDEFFESFLGYISSRRPGGHNVPKSGLSFVLAAVGELLMETIDFISKRRGKQILIAKDLSAVYAVASWVAPGGWLRRNPQLAEKLVPIEGVLTLAQCEAARRDWNAFCDDTDQKFQESIKSFAGSITSTAGRPLRKLADILNSSSSVIFLSEFSRFYNKRVARSLPGSLRWGKQLRNAICAEIYSQNYFRSRTQRETTWHADNTGHLRRTAERDQLYIHKDQFKNGEDGPFFKDGDYYVGDLADDNGLRRNLDAYLKPVTGGRALILAGKASDRLLVKTGKYPDYDGKSFYDYFTSIARRFIASNPDADWASMDTINPHAVRAIGYNEIYKSSGDDEIASDALQITPRTGKKHYKFRPPEQRTAVVTKIRNRSRGRTDQA